MAETHRVINDSDKQTPFPVRQRKHTVLKWNLCIVYTRVALIRDREIDTNVRSIDACWVLTANSGPQRARFTDQPKAIFVSLSNALHGSTGQNIKSPVCSVRFGVWYAMSSMCGHDFLCRELCQVWVHLVTEWSCFCDHDYFDKLANWPT